MLANLGLSKAEPPMGFVVLMKNVLFGPFALLKEMKLKKRNTDGVVLHKPYPNPG